MRKTRVVMAGIGLMGIGLASPAGAQTYVNQPVPVVGSSDSGRSGEVLGASGSRPVLAQTAQQAPVVAAQQGGRLAFTGGDIAGLVLIGLALAGSGTVAVRVARRPQSPTAVA